MLSGCISSSLDIFFVRWKQRMKSRLLLCSCHVLMRIAAFATFWWDRSVPFFWTGSEPVSLVRGSSWTSLLEAAYFFHFDLCAGYCYTPLRCVVQIFKAIAQSGNRGYHRTHFSMQRMLVFRHRETVFAVLPSTPSLYSQQKSAAFISPCLEYLCVVISL